MPEAVPSHEFDLHVLAQLEKFFKEGETETLVASPAMPFEASSLVPAVMVKHIPSGKEAVSKKYTSQIRNKIDCLLTLLLDTNRLS